MPVSGVTTGDVITEAWGDSVASSVNALEADLAADVAALAAHIAAGGAGTSFPGSPAANERFYRTDRGIDYYWNGTRWLSVALYGVHPGVSDVLMPFTATNYLWAAAPWAGIYDLWLVDFQCTFYVGTGSALSGTHKWTLAATKVPAISAFASSVISSGALSTYRTITPVAIGALLGLTENAIYVGATKAGTPGSIFAWPQITYRLVG